MLNYAGEYGEYCSTCQSAVTVIVSSDAAVKSSIERQTVILALAVSASIDIRPILSLYSHAILVSSDG